MIKEQIRYLQQLYVKLMKSLDTIGKLLMNNSVKTQKQDVIIPNDRRYYLREITDTVRGYHKKAEQQVELARSSIQLEGHTEASYHNRKKH